MPKIIFEKNEKNLIPDSVSVKELEDGTFEADAAGVLSKNKELLKKNAGLQTKAEEAEAAKEVAEANATEWKNKAKLPEGQVLVSSDVAELGTAAKEAGIVKDEIPTWKTKVDDLQTKIDGFESESVAGEVAKAIGYDERFKKAAKKEGWKFEKQGEGETATWHVIAGENKPKVEDFLKEDDFYKDIDFTASESGNTWVRQESGKESKTPANMAEAHMKKRYAGIPKQE